MHIKQINTNIISRIVLVFIPSSEGFFFWVFFLDDSYLTRQVSSTSGEIVP